MVKIVNYMKNHLLWLGMETGTRTGIGTGTTETIGTTIRTIRTTFP